MINIHCLNVFLLQELTPKSWGTVGRRDSRGLKLTSLWITPFIQWVFISGGGRGYLGEQMGYNIHRQSLTFGIRQSSVYYSYWTSKSNMFISEIQMKNGSWLTQVVKKVQKCLGIYKPTWIKAMDGLKRKDSPLELGRSSMMWPCRSLHCWSWWQRVWLSVIPSGTKRPAPKPGTCTTAATKAPPTEASSASGVTSLSSTPWCLSRFMSGKLKVLKPLQYVVIVAMEIPTVPHLVKLICFSVEVIRLGQSKFINWDLQMYFGDKDTPAKVH